MRQAMDRPPATLLPGTTGEPATAVRDEMVRILYVEKDALLSRDIGRVLERQGWNVDVANDGPSGLRLARERSYQVAALEWSLPGEVDGAQICREIRVSAPQTSVLVFSARTWEDDIVDALESGADEYLAKPCSPRTLIARIRVHLKRFRGSEPPPSPTPATAVVSHASIQLDLVAQRVQVDSRVIELTRQQFQLLAHMMTNLGRAIPREEFRRYLFRTAHAERSANLRKQVKGLREALGEAGALVQTARGAGYGMGLS